MKRIARGLYHRSPRLLQRIVLESRGALWRRQIPEFLNSRPPVPKRIRPVSVVIPSYNDIPLLTKCLASLSATLQPDDEVIVVDDYCEPRNRAELLKLENQQTRVILKDERGGFAKTVNRGMAEARFDIILLNSDIVALPNWVEFLQAAADSADNIGLVSAKLLYPDGRIQYGGTFWARSFAPQWFAHRFGGAKFDFAPSNIRRFNWGAGGACMYVTRAAYEALGGLDEEYWLGFEDVDYAMSAWSKGFSSVFEPDAVLFHHESATRGFHQGNRELGSMRTFWNKWWQLHNERTVNHTNLRVVVAADEDQLWLEYASAVGKFLNAPVEHAEQLSGEFDGVTLVMSESALEAVWLSHSRVGLPVALPREIPGRYSPRGAAFQPEFDYIVRNSSEQSALEAGIGWPALSIVTPWVSANPMLSDDARSVDILISFNQSTEDLKNELLRAFPAAVTLESPTPDSLVDSARSTSPRILVNLCGWATELDAMGVLASGCVVIAPEDASLQWLLQNGLNCFTGPLEFSAIEERLAGVMNDVDTRSELVRNAKLTVENARAKSMTQLKNSIRLALAQRASSSTQ